jgi:hypothetical protein
MWVCLPLFIHMTCTTAAAPPNVRKRDTLQTARGTCSLPLYRCRCNDQVRTCSQITSLIVPWHCGVRRCSSNDRRHSWLNSVVCGGWMSRNWSGVGSMPWFRVCMVVGLANQNIRRTQSRKRRQLLNASRACNACRDWWQFSRVS